MKLGEIAQIQNGNIKLINSVTFQNLLSTGHQSTEYVIFKHFRVQSQGFCDSKTIFWIYHYFF